MEKMAVKQVFVGRERQLEELFAILDKALKGQGQVVFITGETGTGKTELAREFFRRAQERYKDLIVAIG
ncbi:MAG TPA: ATP-binding protein, partial [Anaerolineae bacterium]|nr:ATP-binding protein [Anaerolineae bacterium]